MSSAIFVEGPVVMRPGKRERLFAKLCAAACAILLFFFLLPNALALPPDDQFPTSIIHETQFESVRFQPEEIPPPLPQEISESESAAEPSDSQTILAPDQPGNIQRGAGQQLGGTSDPNDTVLDPNQVGNLMTRLML